MADVCTTPRATALHAITIGDQDGLLAFGLDTAPGAIVMALRGNISSPSSRSSPAAWSALSPRKSAPDIYKQLLRVGTPETTLSREQGKRAETLIFGRSSRRSSIPVGHSLGPEGAQGTTGNQMALEVEGVVGGGMHRNEALQTFEVWKQATFIRMAA